MVAAGEATVEEIDAAIAWGPGLRWAQMGPCLTFHLAGGSGGMAAMTLSGNVRNAGCHVCATASKAARWVSVDNGSLVGCPSPRTA